MRIAAALAVALLAYPAANGYTAEDPALRKQLAQLFPEAASFSEKRGSPAHYEAFGKALAGGGPELLGYAYWTTELEPLERGYDGPIKILVGMDTSGVITGIIVTEDHEPYGYFSVELPEFAEQFKGKNVRDRFKVGEDIDAITRATISVTSASRAVRNSSRRIARAYLTPPAEAPAKDGSAGSSRPTAAGNPAPSGPDGP
ncbi:MAG TPA: FMN-binding protein [Gammaproteobacteria bacterium]|nr:FMN-binding protein [Gammaproteobacteria bacterium]